MTTLFHADDFGITDAQAHAIIALSDVCGGRGALDSISVCANSPAFEKAAALAAPFVMRGSLHAGVHLNLVEGRPCSDPTSLPLLVGPRGTFCHDFVGLLRLSQGPRRDDLRREIERETAAQIRRFLKAFPNLDSRLRIDSHQHTHAIPLVFDACLAAADGCGCTLEHVRTPVEPLAPHLTSMQTLKRIPPINLAKDALLALLWHRNRGKLPIGCRTSLFCGVVLSGRMERVDADLLSTFQTLAKRRNLDLEMLFHPISIPLEDCLDPDNEPFATACSSPARDREARTLERLG